MIVGKVAILIHGQFVCKAVSNRITYVVLKINGQYKIQIIQTYAPTATASEEEIE